MKKKLFDIVISVETDGKTVTADICCHKDGKNFTQDALEGENLRLACESLRQAMGLFARRFFYEQKEKGVISEEYYNEIVNGK